MSEPFFIDGDITVASKYGPPRPAMPFPDNKIYIWEQDYTIATEFFAPLALDTAYDVDGTFFLVEETSPEPIGAHMVKWTRVYAKVPTARNEFESTVYTFPGWGFNGSGGDTVPARDPITETVPSRLAYSYFLTADPMLDIPSVPRFKVYFTGSVSAYTDTLGNITTPTKADYIALIGIEIVTEDSTFRRWRGNIYERIVRYVVAK